MADKPQEKREYKRVPLTPLSIAEYNEFRRWKNGHDGGALPEHHQPIAPPTLDAPPSLWDWVVWGLVVGGVLWFLVMLL